MGWGESPQWTIIRKCEGFFFFLGGGGILSFCLFSFNFTSAADMVG